MEDLLQPSLNIDVKAVLSKVNFRDTPIIVLLSLHSLLLIAALIFRSHRFWRTVVFVICIVFAVATEKIGAFLAGHWRAFGFSEDYFDENGVFLLFFFAVPPLFICILLFSHLVGGIGGRIVERYIEGRRDRQPPATVPAEATKAAEEVKLKSE
jgi:hypothetical protein